MWVFLLGFSLFLSLASAEENEELLSFVSQSDRYLSSIGEALSRQQYKVAPDCPIVRFLPLSYTVYQPVTFEDGKPMTGLWYQHFEAYTDCSDELVYRSAMVEIRAPDALAITTMVAGRTIASPNLQMDVLYQPQLRLSVSTALDACDDDVFQVIDTEVLKRPQEVEFPTWSELWTLNVCGKELQRRINFETTPTGVDFTIPLTRSDIVP